MRTALRALLALAAFSLPGPALAGEQTLVFRTAPITIGPYEVGQGVQIVDHPQVDGYVVGMSADVVDADGSIVPIRRVMLHHVVFAKLGARDLTCPNAPTQRFYAAGEERTQMALPPGYGYPNGALDNWGMLYMLMNHRPLADTVRVQYTVRYVTDEPLTPVKPIWLDEHNCSADPIFNVPGNGKVFSTWSTSTDWIAPESGVLVAAGAHLHGGGLRLELSDTTCGRSLFASEPTWGLPLIQPVMHEPGPLHMSGFTSAEGLPVAAGARLRLTAVYDNSLPHVRAMGIMIAYFAPRPVAGCAALPPLDPDPESRPGAPPRIRLPLLREPRGPFTGLSATWVSDFAYGRQRVALRSGSTFTWRFAGPALHDVTLASGPVGFASPWSSAGSTFSFRFTKPGTYRLFCSLHPARMTQVVVVSR
jgi:hypothetical protein